ncbi:hypothetical protein NKR23_g6340 [Pleurostoma richardsiae]|uniref:Fungal N-terminal domain-containing protein n=1 Tax=Pleurostoma richardsiae TaxID=41990 RepID=A0AA38RE16_9PEZI|nr:hypothetical protein NKR23_g6340 [Pleurostoma richardsiae]
MEVAAAAAGFISLGIQVAGGVVTYLDAVKARQQDLEAATERARQLHVQLQTIESATRAPDAQHQEMTNNVRVCATECKKRLKLLEDFLVEISGCRSSAASSSGSLRLKESVEWIKQNGTYPFKRRNIETLEKRLEGANEALQVALMTLNVCLSSTVHDNVSAVLAGSKSLETKVLDMYTKADMGFRRTELVLRDQSQQLEQSLPVIEQKLTNVRGTVDAIHSAQVMFSTQLVSVEDMLDKALQQ